ncbi:MAG: transposase [Tissierellales bacterium]|jgi:putative transposase|nr:transposase [Desulfobacterales bacterium]MBN2826833.1 transposase [Tissierellales bacterium]
MKQVSPYLKMQVLAAIDYVEGKTRRERIKKVSQLKFKDEDGCDRSFTWRTISTWYCRYTKHGITSVKPKERADKGKTRKITPEILLEAINQVLPFFKNRFRNKMDIFRKIIELGIIHKHQLGQTTFYRYIREHDLLSDSEPKDKRRLAFAMEYANQLWQGDTMYGPYVRTASGHQQTKLVAFIDDASRVITHGQFFLSENIDALITTLRAAFYKRGVPEQIYVDNGGIYTSKELILICARVGCILRHAPVRDGASKGKIERFFRRVRDQFLVRQLDLSSLDKLNRQFSLWVEDEYNAHNHSAINMKPVDRFAMDLKRIRYLPPSEINDELFFDEDTRKVKKDNTFYFRNKRYETPADFRNKSITIRFDRSKATRIVVYYKDARIGEAKVLDLIANANLRRGGKK